MVRQTIGLGSLLVILGVGTFGMLGFNLSNWTPLIPAFFGVLFLGLGLLARGKDPWEGYLIPATLVLALLIFLAMSPALVQVPSVIAGQPMERPLAVLLQAIVAVLVGGYIALGVQSLLEARNNREAAL